MWLLSDDRLLRYRAGEFALVSHDMKQPVSTMHAHPGGVWLVGSNQACHVATGPSLRLHGLHGFAHTKSREISFELSSNNSQATLSASLQDAEIALTRDEQSGRFAGTAVLPTAGWHLLTLQAPGVDQIVPLRQDAVDWARDIEPIFQLHCNDCHHDSSAASLASEAAWRQHATAIRARVVTSSDMPPVEQRKPSWSTHQVALIDQWLTTQAETN